MNNFKKCIISTAAVIFLFLLFSISILEPFFHSEMFYYQDNNVREELKGKIDTLIVGASNSLCAFDPRILDEKLNKNSYNLSGSLMTLNGRKFMLEKELNRNNVNTVYLDVSYETFTRDESNEKAEGDSVTYAKLSSLTERIKYLFTSVPINNWANIYKYHFYPNSFDYDISKIFGNEVRNVDYSAKGFWSRKINNIEYNEKEAKKNHRTIKLNMEYREKNIEQFTDLINLCKKHNANVILVVSPVADCRLLKEYGQDDFYKWMSNYAKENDCQFYDTNLLKNRYNLINDQDSFFDTQHLSYKGAKIFTEEFCKILKLSESEDVSKYFYDSYEDMKKDSPYMKYLK